MTPGIYGTDYYDYDDITLAKVEDGTLVPGSVLAIDPALADLATTGTPFGAGQVCYFVGFLGDPSLVSTSFVSNTASGDTAHPVMLFMWK
jgi:hypothetical protein